MHVILFVANPNAHGSREESEGKGKKESRISTMSYEISD